MARSLSRRSMLGKNITLSLTQPELGIPYEAKLEI
jgi:hypothetical protein